MLLLRCSIQASVELALMLVVGGALLAKPSASQLEAVPPAGFRFAESV